MEYVIKMVDYVHIIGIDCSVDQRKVGLTSGIYSNGQLAINKIILGDRNKPISIMVFEMCEEHNVNLIAIDAPLGWPQDMGTTLSNHVAGDPILVEDNIFFRRETDRFIKRKIGKQPLDIGADRIARTAYAALKILKELSEYNKIRIPLAWSCQELKRFSAIEVYPAATLKSHNTPNTGYKDYGEDPIKETIISFLEEHMQLPEKKDLIMYDSNALDSVVCVMAAKDFLDGKVVKPKEIELARKEGWIWVYDAY